MQYQFYNNFSCRLRNPRLNFINILRIYFLCFAQLFSSYILALSKGLGRKKAYLYKTRVRKMLMKLTP